MTPEEQVDEMLAMRLEYASPTPPHEWLGLTEAEYARWVEARELPEDYCATCKRKREILFMYPRPGSPPGNTLISCPDCRG